MGLITKASMDLLARHGDDVIPDLMAIYEPGDKGHQGCGLLTACMNATRSVDVLSVLLAKGHQLQPDFLSHGVADWVARELLGDLSGLDFSKCCEPILVDSLMRWPLCQAKSGLILRELPKIDELPLNAISELVKRSAPHLFGLPCHPNRPRETLAGSESSQIEMLALQTTQAIDVISRNPKADSSCLSWIASQESRKYWGGALRGHATLSSNDLLRKWVVLADANSIASISGALSGKVVPASRPVRI